MTLLLGQETESAGAEESGASEKAYAFKFTAAATGKVTALHFLSPKSGTGTVSRIAIQENEGGATGKPKSGVMVEAEITSTIGAHEVAVAETEVISGTEYWLTLDPQGGTSRWKQGSTTALRKGTTATKKISEVGANWAAESKLGPISIWATGTTGSTGLLAGKAPLVFGVKGALNAQAALAGKTSIAITGKAALNAQAVLAGVSRLVFRQAGSLAAEASLAGKSALRFGQQATLLAQATLAGVGKLRFATAGKLASTGGAAVRKVFLAIFED